MSGKRSTVFALIVIAGMINAGAKVYENHDPIPSMVGSFVVLLALVALAGAGPFGNVAVAFAAAFLITSGLLNLKPIISAFSSLEGVK